MRSGAGPALAAALAVSTPAPAGVATLPGWAVEDHGAGLAVWARSCDPALPACAEAARAEDPRSFWESRFEAVPLPAPVLVTGYFEPEIAARRSQAPGFGVPLHALPGDPALLAHDRAAIAAGALAGRALELFWLADPVDAFFLHVQGSGRLLLPGGEVVRVGYAGRNAHPYVAIGRVMAEREGIAPAEITADGLAEWLRADPARGAEAMARNPSYIFFAERGELDPAEGPVGSAGVPLTALRSVALDPAHVAPGSALWLVTEIPDAAGGSVPFARLVVAQDTGSAIAGPGRADLFFGPGAAAGLRAGRMRAEGRLVLLRPRAEAGR